MKYVLSSLIIALIMQSCMSTNNITRNDFPCSQSNFDASGLMKEISNICTDEGFMPVTDITSEMNTLAFRGPDQTTGDLYHHIEWKFQIKDSVIYAWPTLHIHEGYSVWIGKVSASSTLLGDQTHEDYVGYWAVRLKIEDLCGERVRIRKAQKGNGKSIKEQSLQKKS